MRESRRPPFFRVESLTSWWCQGLFFLFGHMEYGTYETIKLIRLMGRMGMIWWWKSLFYPNSFLCSNPNILTIIFITLSLWWFLHGQSLLALAHLKTAPVPCQNLPVEKSLHSWDWSLLSGSYITVMSWLLIAFILIIEASARSDFRCLISEAFLLLFAFSSQMFCPFL